MRWRRPYLGRRVWLLVLKQYHCLPSRGARGDCELSAQRQRQRWNLNKLFANTNDTQTHVAVVLRRRLPNEATPRGPRCAFGNTDHQKKVRPLPEVRHSASVLSELTEARERERRSVEHDLRLRLTNLLNIQIGRLPAHKTQGHMRSQTLTTYLPVHEYAL